MNRKNMHIVDFTGVNFIVIDGKFVKYWVYQLVREAVNENLDRVQLLDWFYLSQLVGDESWDYLAVRGELQNAGRCFRYMVNNRLVPIEHVSKAQKDTKCYRVNKAIPAMWRNPLSLSIVQK